MSGEAEDAGGLTPVKDDNEAWRKSARKDCRILIEEQYDTELLPRGALFLLRQGAVYFLSMEMTEEMC